MTLLHEACFLEDEEASLDIARQLLSNGVSADARATLFNLPFTAFDVACCMGKVSVCEMLLDAQPGADWLKGSIDLVTRQASAIAEYINDQEKYKQCVELLQRRVQHAVLTSTLYESVEQGDEKRVRALLAHVSIAQMVSDEGDSGELMRLQLIALASQNSKNLRVLTLLQAFLKANTHKHLQEALMHIAVVFGAAEDGSNMEELVPEFLPFCLQAGALIDAGVVLREAKSQTGQKRRVCLENLLCKLCPDEAKYAPHVLQLLLNAKVDPNAAGVRAFDDSPQTPLFRACLHGHAHTVKLLLDANASADTPAVVVSLGSGTTINATPLVATILKGNSPTHTELVLDALGWRVSKTGLAALVSMAPTVREFEMVRARLSALSSLSRA